MPDVLAGVPARHGHFLLESGYHTDRWLDLDALFVDTARMAPLVAALASRLRVHRVSAICGPLLGGAFLAQAVASVLGVGFYYTEPEPADSQTGLFVAGYRLPSELQRRIRGERLAVTDDVISAGSSVRATIAAIQQAGATTVAVGALVALGDAAVDYLTQQAIPLETLDRQHLTLWKPDSCPLCRNEQPLVDPRKPLTVATTAEPDRPATT
ncbi:MAG TPA: phosphoribosyltransferase family protein [Gemmatimonadaceae bacterium]|nr:phosphoribosyltransferase family protein [Gemmatimonadaceae bacterium]